MPTSITSFGEGAVALDGLVAKHLLPGVDNAIAVSVPHQHAIVRARPGGGVLDTVAVGIEQNTLGERGNFQTVAIQIEYQRINADVVDGFD